MANVITVIRILLSIILLFTRTFSDAFFALYSAAGISDALDGIVARKFHLESKSGEKLDTIADMCFVGAALYKLLPALQIPVWLWLWIGVIALIKLANILSVFLHDKTLAAEHTAANKITGILLFLFPFSLSFLPLTYSAIVVCSMATIAAVHESRVDLPVIRSSLQALRSGLRRCRRL